METPQPEVVWRTPPQKAALPYLTCLLFHARTLFTCSSPNVPDSPCFITLHICSARSPLLLLPYSYPKLVQTACPWLTSLPTPPPKAALPACLLVSAAAWVRQLPRLLPELSRPTLVSSPSCEFLKGEQDPSISESSLHPALSLRPVGFVKHTNKRMNQLRE